MRLGWVWVWGFALDDDDDGAGRKKGEPSRRMRALLPFGYSSEASMRSCALRTESEGVGSQSQRPWRERVRP